MRSVLARDVIERAGWAFVEGAVGGVVLTQYTEKSMWLAAITAGASAALSVLKSALASRGGTGSASLSKQV